jgi:hypothetical protein
MRLPSPTPLRALGRQAACVASLSAVTLSGCAEVPTGPRALPVTISGSLTNPSAAPIPANARVVALWAVDDGSGDYAYIFGEGTVDRATNRFTVTFDEGVPSAALLGDALGVGMVILTTDPNLGEGRVPDLYDYRANVIGATGQHAVIYLNDEPPRFAPEWPSDFRRGYNVGVGRDLPGTFDGFAPTRLNAMQLIVDDLADIETVNWS